MLKPGGYFLLASDMRYDKPALSIDDQVERLRERGMVFSDAQRVRHYLTYIGYYRLSAYWLPFEDQPAAGQPRSHRFRSGTTFEAVLSLYIFDRQLRLLVMEALERIEISVRTHWAHALATHHGPHAHLTSQLFDSPWQHAKDIARMAGELQNSRETFVEHYRSTYSDPYLPPIWAVVETLSLGALSRWFKATKDHAVKAEISKQLGLPSKELAEKVLHALTPVRNICAHHSRLWNRRFTIQLPLIKHLRTKDPQTGKQLTTRMEIDSIPTAQGNQQQPARTLYNYLLVMAHMMNHINPGSSWKARLQSLVSTRSEQDLKTMGFPDNWESLPVWGITAPR